MVLLCEAPSLTVTVIVTFPTAPAVGVSVKRAVSYCGSNLMVGVGIMAGLLDPAVSVRAWSSQGAPGVTPVSVMVCGPGLAGKRRLAIGLRVGGTLGGSPGV